MTRRRPVVKASRRLANRHNVPVVAAANERRYCVRTVSDSPKVWTNTVIYRGSLARIVGAGTRW